MNCKLRKPDVVFNLFEGNLDNSETECYVTGLLEWAGVAFTGSPHAAFYACAGEAYGEASAARCRVADRAIFGNRGVADAGV